MIDFVFSSVMTKTCIRKYFRTRIIASLSILFSFSSPAFSQDSLSSSAALAEKIYLQLDRTIYSTDETIWFKAIVTNAGSHVPGGVSGVLYAELIDAHENILDRKLIKLAAGIGDGFFQLSSAYSNGTYQVRAYTEWNKNFGSGFYFTTYIQVASIDKQPNTFDPIKKLYVQDGKNGERRLNVQADPSLSDSVSGRILRFVVQANGKNDTIPVKRNRSNQYLLDYAVPTDCDLITLQIANDNGVNYSQTIVIDTNAIDLQFFPESGELVQGLPGLLGVKAVDYEGRGRKVEGEIVNEKGGKISHFITNELGMGVVNIGVADSNAHYHAKIVSNKERDKKYYLPGVVSRGNNLSVKKKEDKIIIKASSNYKTGDSIIVRASCRGILYFDFAGKLNNGTLEFTVDQYLLPEGIIDFTLLLKTSMLPVAERLYFNEMPEERLPVKVSIEKQEYDQREETKVTIKIPSSTDEPALASLSLLAISQSPDAKQLSLRQNILSYFLLSSDLKGRIEDPGYYFQPPSRFDDLDALLLTQGWRKYNYTRDTVRFQYPPEKNLALAGNVKGGLSDNKIIKGAGLTLMAFSKPPFFASGTTDDSGRFRFELADEYSDNLEVLIQSSDKSNKKKNYSVMLDRKYPPPTEFMRALSVRKPDSTVQAYIEQSIERRKAEDEYQLEKNGSVLKEVIVTARSLSPVQKEMADKYGNPSLVISGAQIQAKEEKWSYGLYSVLLFQFPMQVKITKYPNGFMYASLHNSEPTLVVIDGIPVNRYDYGMIPYIPPSEVKSFELIPYANNFHALFCEAISCGFGTPSVGNVIAIYTHAGKGIHGARATVGITKTVVPVFSTPREFYAPKYDQLKPDDWQKPDLRNLVHWAPRIKPDTTGRSTISFYNSDCTGPVRIIVEAISANGEIGYSEFVYDVKKKNTEDASKGNK